MRGSFVVVIRVYSASATRKRVATTNPPALLPIPSGGRPPPFLLLPFFFFLLPLRLAVRSPPAFPEAFSLLGSAPA